MTDLSSRVRTLIRDVPDFPEEGILFKDITPLLSDAEVLGRVIGWFAESVGNVDRVVGMESRGFLFGVPLALQLGVPFVPARKAGKLPHHTIGVEYALEYGTAKLELHADAIGPGERVVVVDDLLATGGTAAATCDLVRRLGGDVVACAFLIELAFLDGRRRLDMPVHALIRY